jgi:serine/threonine protein kinase
VKTIGIAGIMLGMGFLHSLGLISGAVKSSNILFDYYRRIQIAAFGRRRLDLCERVAIARGVFSVFEAPEMQFGDEGIAKIDLFSFILIPFEIVADLLLLGRITTSERVGKHQLNACRRVESPGFVPELVSVLIQSELSANQRERSLSENITETLKENHQMSHDT